MSMTLVHEMLNTEYDVGFPPFSPLGCARLVTRSGVFSIIHIVPTSCDWRSLSSEKTNHLDRMLNAECQAVF
jgi:hypothetical protein